MEFVSKTDVGKRRTNNEDSLYSKIYDKDLALFIVADGLGGYNSGEVASQMLTKSMSKYVESHLSVIESLDDSKIQDVMKNALNYANSEIFELEKTDEKYQSMATTVVVVLFTKSKIYYLCVGDSRIYYIDTKKEKIEQITEDDTYVNELLRINVINEEDVDSHPKKHMLTKAVGIMKNIDAKINILDKEKGYLLLCTDGITNMIKNNILLDIFKNNEFEDIADNLIQIANSNGGIDNITVTIVKY